MNHVVDWIDQILDASVRINVSVTNFDAHTAAKKLDAADRLTKKHAMKLLSVCETEDELYEAMTCAG